MAGSSDPTKATLWQRRFQRFMDSGLSLARFCGVEGVSEASFYYWQKKLGPTRRCGRVRGKSRNVCASGRGGKECDRSVFRPVTVVPATCGVVVRLPGGARIEVDAAHLDAIRAVVAETLRGVHGRVPEQDVPSNNHVNRKRGGIVSC